MKTCFLIRYTPDSRRNSVGIVLRKPGKDDYYNPKSYLTIKLGLVPVTQTERVILWHMEVDLNILRVLKLERMSSTTSIFNYPSLNTRPFQHALKELADKLANMGSDTPPRLFLLYAKSLIHSRVLTAIHKEHHQRLVHCTGLDLMTILNLITI